MAPELTLAHEKEMEIIQSLRTAHLAMVDAFVDQKIAVFDDFFFDEYSQAFQRNWIESFSEVMGREYDPDRDFATLSNDLIAEYQELTQPIQQIRGDLKTAIEREYANVAQIHGSVGHWIRSVEQLSNSQRTAMNDLLQRVDPELDVTKIENTVEAAVNKGTLELEKIKDALGTAQELKEKLGTFSP